MTREEAGPGAMTQLLQPQICKQVHTYIYTCMYAYIHAGHNTENAQTSLAHLYFKVESVR